MILVTGANGMVGSYVEEAFKGENIVMTDLPEMDVTSKQKVFSLVEKYKPKTVLHLAAETNVDKCESEIDHAYRTNTIGTVNIALACQKIGAEMIYISTGGVFDSKGKYESTEFDKPRPLNKYADSKYQGELAVKDLLTRFYIFRAGWMIGGGPKRDKKFVGKIIELCQTKPKIEAVSDKFGSPTFAQDFVKGIREVIKTGNYGLYHLVNKGSVSRYEIAREIVKCMNKDVEVVPVTSERFPLPAPRAESEAMKNYKLDLMGINPMPDWRKSLKTYISEWG